MTMHAPSLIPAALAVVAMAACGAPSAEPPVKTAEPAAVTRYAQDFTGSAKPPEDLMILTGDFTVVKDGDNAVLELGPTPLETFNLLFGPTAKVGLMVSARLKGVAKARQGPTFGIGLGGVSGHVLQIAGTKKQLELMRDGNVLASVAFDWKSDTWVRMQLRVRATGAGAWSVEGRAWPDGTPAPAAWQVTFAEKDEPISGRASLWGAPYGGRPIRYDDLVVEPVASP